jgi:cytochrome P450
MVTTQATSGEVEPGWYGLDSSNFDRNFDPHPQYRRLREEAPVHPTPLGYWRVSRYADVVRVLRELPAGVRTTAGHLPGVSEEMREGAFMLEQDPPTHTRLRKLVSKAFTPRATEQWRPRARALVDELLASVEATGGDLDIIADLALPVPATLICEMLGVPVEDREKFTVWTADATHGLAGERAPEDVQQRATIAAMELAGYFEAQIGRRRSSQSDDILSVLIRAEEEGDRLSPQELLIQSIGLLIAGFETTIGLIGNGIRQLALHPEELARLHAHPEHIASAVEECLRFDGPIDMTSRVLHADAELGGCRIPKDSEVWLLLAAANRDPERFTEPERFDITRRDNAHLAFGGGTHLCLGTHLARMEAQEAIGGLVRRFGRIELESETVEWGRSLFRVPARLPVRVR